jgi:putative transposase
MCFQQVVETELEDAPMWAKATRAQHSRDGLRFASDLTDAEWAVLEPLLPAPSPVGRPPTWPMRTIVEAIFYMLRGGALVHG